MREDIQEVLVSRQQIAETVARLGAEISRDYADKVPMMVSVLKGGFMFMADLVRAIDIPCTLDFLSVSSYASGTVSSGQVKIIKDLDTTITGRHVIVVEDILDSGLTLSHLLKLLQARNPASISLCTLFDKPERRKVQVEVAYKGITVTDAFIV